MAQQPCTDRTVVPRVGSAALAVALIAGACSQQPSQTRESVVDIVPGAPAVTAGVPALIHAHPMPNATPLVAPIAPPSAAPVAMLRKGFTDPPLPPELRDDGGLTPLPPRPAASAMATAMHPTFEGAAPSATGEETP